MKLGMTLYIQNTIEAVELYKKAFGLTLGEDMPNFRMELICMLLCVKMVRKFLRSQKPLLVVW